MILRTFPFKLQPAGGPFEDPALLVTPTNQDSAVLLDCGTIHGLKTRDLQKVRWLFLSHLHIDHLIGFDHLLRVRLFSELPLTVYGPEGTVEAIGHRLRGYAWNLTSGSPFVVNAFDLGSQAGSACFRCHDRFIEAAIEDERERPDSSGRVRLDPTTAVACHPLDHGVPCLAYRLDRVLPPKFSLETAQSLGLQPGPWVKSLVSGQPIRLAVGEFERDQDWLSERLLSPPVRSSLGYLTDTRLTEPLTLALSGFFRKVDVLCCESAYLAEEAETAEKNLHMTTSGVARLAALCEVSELRIVHLSRRHHDAGSEKHLAQVREVFPESYLLADASRAASETPS